jgi:glycosyltransferase involved in cell wall biosynthesis
VRSAICQSHQVLEVLVSDDASSNPAMRQVASQIAAADPRVRVVRQPRNLGHAANYQWVLEAARGEFFMWLSDDDWIDPEYVARCLAAVREHGAVLVCGLARYYRDGVHVLDERPIELASPHPGLRVIRYFALVSLNGPLFGIARREQLLSVGFPPVVGGDWLLMAGLAARGRVRTLNDVNLHRSLTGLGADSERLARSFGMRGVVARHHHVVFAARLWADIAVCDPAFRVMNPIARVCAATSAAGLILSRFAFLALVRRAIGPGLAASLESRISAWLRARKAK